MNIEAIGRKPSLYYYRCLDCHDSFICPDWQRRYDDEISNKLAVCPYCKSNQLEPLNVELPLMV